MPRLLVLKLVSFIDPLSVQPHQEKLSNSATSRTNITIGRFVVLNDATYLHMCNDKSIFLSKIICIQNPVAISQRYISWTPYKSELTHDYQVSSSLRVLLALLKGDSLLQTAECLERPTSVWSFLDESSYPSS